MNSFLFSLICLTASLTVSLTASIGLAQPTLIETSFHTSYIPNGFDTNDQVQIVGEGLFPDTCYRPATPEVVIDHDAKTVTITPRAYRYDGMVCADMVVEYHQVLNLNLLHAGDYKIAQRNVKQEFGQIEIAVAANSDPDEFLYAPIEQAHFSNGSARGTGSIKLNGEFTDSCTQLTNVRVSVQPNVIVVQPIATRDERGPRCTPGRYPFQRTVEVSGLRSGKYLLHVRSLNAQAVNSLVSAE